MTDQQREITDDQLHAYVDGFLDEVSRGAVERHLAQHADAAVRVRAWQALNAGLQQLGNRLSADPGRVLDWRRGTDELAGRRARRRPVILALQAAAVAASLAIGLFAGWQAHDSWSEGEDYQFVKQAAVAYKVFASPIQARPVEITADERDRLQRWLSGKMGLNFAMRVPQLEGQGWNLVGGRMLSDARGPAALYVYENSEKRRLALYVTAMQAPVKQGGIWTQDTSGVQGTSVEICDWGKDRLHMALVGQVPRDQLKMLLGPINEQIVATAGAPADTVAVPRLPDPRTVVSLNSAR
jgi:anti-sigma factor RsiW